MYILYDFEKMVFNTKFHTYYNYYIHTLLIMGSFINNLIFLYWTKNTTILYFPKLCRKKASI